MSGLNWILDLPGSYRLLGKIACVVTNARVAYARQYLGVKAGERVLDLGCGPGDILSALPDCDYVGVDVEARYIEAARKRFGGRGTFRCEPLEHFVLEAPESFDLVMANGVLHHLDDRQADAMLGLAARAMKRNGRTVTLDGCYIEGQSRVAKALLRRDRGKFVRGEEAYLRLARPHFTEVRADVRHDLLSLPYTLLIMTCRGQRCAPYGSVA
jgi:SAM-dependent methyltransferase